VTAAEPRLTVVRGHPTAEDVAALTVTVMAVRARAARAAAAGRQQPPAGWARRASLLRGPVSHGPGGWRRSGLPG
jgi:hypothetical protein